MDISPVKKLHILAISFPAYGHIIPLLELAKKISHFHTVTFAVSSALVPDLTKRGLIDQYTTVQLYPVQDARAAELDTDALEGGMDQVFEQYLPAVNKLLHQMPTRKDPLTLNRLQPIDVVIGDFFVGKELGACREREIPFYMFSTGTLFQVEFVLALNSDFPTVPDSEADTFVTVTEPGKPLVPVGVNLKKQFLPMKASIALATGLIVNSFRDIELEGVRNVTQSPLMAGRTVHCVGPLISDIKTANSSTQSVMEKNVVDWLDRQKANSVVYVSWGSVATPTPEQLATTGQALLALGRPFIWALQEKCYGALPEDLTANVESQFEKSPFLMLNWAPQKTILKHEAVAVFVSHCGWNSILEGISNSKPIVGWPMFADQLVNANWIVKLGAGVLIPGTGIKCLRVVPAEEIQFAIEEVGGWKSGLQLSSYSETAKIWKEKINATWSIGGSSYNEFLDLINFHSELFGDRITRTFS